MRIRSLSPDGVRALADRTMSFSVADSTANLVAITGPPASGKTTVLEAIIAAKEDVGPYGVASSPNGLIRAGLDAAKIKTVWELSAPERERFGLESTIVESETLIGNTIEGPGPEPALEALLSSYDATAERGKVEYFHARRDLPLGGQLDLSRAPGDTLDRVSRLASDNAKYAGLIRYIVSAGLGLCREPNGEPSPPGRITSAFAALCSTKRLAGLYQAGDKVLPGFVDQTGTAFGVAQLSDSERDALLFAATWVRAGLVDNQAGSLIVIDTPERHLGHAAAGDLLRKLLSLGPNNQIIVATTSSAVARAAEVVIELQSQTSF